MWSKSFAVILICDVGQGELTTLLVFTAAQNKNKAELGWLHTACVLRTGDPLAGSLFALSAPFALPFKPFPSSPYYFTRFLLFACHVFLYVYHQDIVTPCGKNFASITVI